jgi:hypothetical protein
VRRTTVSVAPRRGDRLSCEAGHPSLPRASWGAGSCCTSRPARGLGAGALRGWRVDLPLDGYPKDIALRPELGESRSRRMPNPRRIVGCSFHAGPVACVEGAGLSLSLAEATARLRRPLRLLVVQGRSGRATRRDAPYHTDAAVAAAIPQRCKGEAVLDGAQQRVVVIPVAVVPAAPAISQHSHRDKRPLSFTPIVPSNSLPKARRTTCSRRASCSRRRSRYCSLCG